MHKLSFIGNAPSCCHAVMASKMGKPILNPCAVVCALLALLSIETGQAATSSAKSATAIKADTLTISTPITRIVYQRDNVNKAVIPITGTCPAKAKQIEARLVPRNPGQGTLIEWRALTPAPAKGAFHGMLTADGGWYNLELRARSGKTILGTSVVERVGIGEVFVVVGHSVAAGGAENIDGATDDRVNTVPFEKSDGATRKMYEKTGDPQYLPSPGFAQYGSGVVPAPFGCGNYFWSMFGEHVAKKENVPVLIYNAAFGGTSLEHWSKSSQNIQFAHSFVKSPIRMPYINLYNTFTKYIPLTGVRAILADQGQNDWPEKNEDLVFRYYETWVKQIRSDFNYPELAIVANRQTPFLRDVQIRKVQERVIQLPHCFPGPDYDKLAPGDRTDAIHFSLSGQTRAAVIWAEALDGNFFKNSKPWQPTFK